MFNVQCQCSLVTLLKLLNRWSVWAEILYWGSSILGAGLVRISAPSDQNNVGHPDDRPLCKWPFAKKQRSTKEAWWSRWSFATILLLHPVDFGNLEDSPLCKWPFAKEKRRPDYPNDHLQQFLLLCPFDFGHPENRPRCKVPFAKERRSTEEAESSRWLFATIHAPHSPWFWSSGGPSCLQMTIWKRKWGTIATMNNFCDGPVLAGIWWYWVSMGQCWLVIGDIGSV